MSPKFKIAPALREFAGIPGTIEVKGMTIGECLDDLVRRYPVAKQWLYDEQGLMRVLVGTGEGETIVPGTGDMKRILDPEEELHLFSIIAGG